MVEVENPELEASMKSMSQSLETLKADRTKDQTAIFELERKLGFLQVHYTYDRAKLMNNSELIEEQMVENEIKLKAENLLARVQAILKGVPE